MFCPVSDYVSVFLTFFRFTFPRGLRSLSFPSNYNLEGTTNRSNMLIMSRPESFVSVQFLNISITPRSFFRWILLHVECSYKKILIELENAGDFSCVPGSRILLEFPSSKMGFHVVRERFLAGEERFGFCCSFFVIDSSWERKSHLMAESTLDRSTESSSDSAFESWRRSTLMLEFDGSDEVLFFLSLTRGFQSTTRIEF